MKGLLRVVNRRFERSVSTFISTPIFYVNAAPHIGHVYTALLADASHRFQKLLSPEPTIFCTGTDEHGTKIQQAAAAAKQPLDAYCSQISSEFKQTFDDCGIEYTDYIRTTEPRHVTAVHRFWETLVNRGEIYSGDYSGWYCDADEAFLTDSQLATITENGKETKVSAESGRPVHWLQESNYKFRLSKFEKDVLYWLKSGNVVDPPIFRKILKTWIESGLMSQDVSVSRPTSRVHWGIPVPGDSSQTVYVWLDALVNYLTVAGYPNLKIWPPTVQVLGKDILKFHGIYWPAFLIAAGLEPPSKLLVHSHWTVDGEKMSKSRGNVVSLQHLFNTYTPEGIRYFLLREGTLPTDSNYSEIKLFRILNSQLADTLGNLLNRCTGKAINKKQWCPPYSKEDFEKYTTQTTLELMNELDALKDTVAEHYTEFNFYRGISTINSALRTANKYFEETKPWELAKDPSQEAHLNVALHIAMETLRLSGITFQPIIPKLASCLLDKLGIPESQRSWSCAVPSWRSDEDHSRILASQKVILYKRILASSN